MFGCGPCVLGSPRGVAIVRDPAAATKQAEASASLDAARAELAAFERGPSPLERLELDAQNTTAQKVTERLADEIERLAALAHGPTRHPDLEVRVECARAALAHGGPVGIVEFFLALNERGVDHRALQLRALTSAWP